MIKNIVFDINGVLQNKISLATVRAFNYNLPEGIVFMKIARTSIWKKYDLGFYQTKQSMIDDFCVMFPKDEKTIKRVLNKRYTPVVNDQMVQFMSKLKENHKVYLLSNVGKGDLNIVMQQSFMPFTDGGVYSCDEGCVKPDEKIYQRLIERYEIKPEESIFIDDGKSNVRTASELGFHTVHYINTKQCRKQIYKIIVREENTL